MFPFQRTVILLFSLACLIISTSSRNTHKVIPIVTSVELRDNLKYLNSSATIHNASTESKVDLAITVTRPLPDPWMNFVVWIDLAAGTLQTPLQNTTFDFCEFLKNPGLHRIGQILHREVKRNGNIPNCPIGPGLYKFCGISTAAMRLPPFIPVASYIMHVFVGVGNEIVYDSRWHGSLKRVKCTSSMRC
ncbi:AGAP010994-PA [Anopheles gambiae str. PEST]|uniref:AGAP010994-PA n=2 Tax=gambiae species complex TaxID=44542 RepID=A7USB3_ANOGA|nr:AGAP010994-PA [Anopheles gambiae str. PEST]